MNAARVRVVSQAPLHADRDYVLYWSVGARRTRANPALDVALRHCRELGKGLVVLDALRVDHPWASRRFHTFIMEGMADVHARYAAAGAVHHGWIEPLPGQGRGLLSALAARACVVVTDDTPTFFLRRMVEAAARKLEVRLEAVDGCGLVPLSSPTREYLRAVDFRRALPTLLDGEGPAADPLDGVRLPPVRLPADVERRWPATPVDPRGLPISQLAPVPLRGGEASALGALAQFLDRIEGYEERRRHPDDDGSSGLSPWLHFGHLSPWTVLDGLRSVAPGPTQPFGVSKSAAAFLDELVTWRELSFHTAHIRPGYDQYSSLPKWARTTLADHECDPREAIYDLDTLAAAATADPVWNAAQRQLMVEGRIHNTLRMLWGKRVLAWTKTAPEAFSRLVELNNRFAIDGRDPNSWSGIAWCFGRYDRPWPSRPVFGAVRTMTSNSTSRKVRMNSYIKRWTP